MSLSAFDIIGPAMIGPSSSHTAGAARIGRVGRHLCESAVTSAEIELHGAFALTGSGHATDRALVAGLLGLAPDDIRLKDSLSLAAAEGLKVQFFSADLGDVHPNSVRMKLETANGERHEIQGSSIGGGRIEIFSVDDYETSFQGDRETLIFWNQDKPGFLARVTGLLACIESNVATIRTSRKSRGEEALTVIEVDGGLPPEALLVLNHNTLINRLRYFHRLP